MLPSDSVQSRLFTALGNHSADVIGCGDIARLVEVLRDAEFFSGGLDDPSTAVVLYVGRHVSR